MLETCPKCARSFNPENGECPNCLKMREEDGVADLPDEKKSSTKPLPWFLVFAVVLFAWKFIQLVYETEVGRSGAKGGSDIRAEANPENTLRPIPAYRISSPSALSHSEIPGSSASSSFGAEGMRGNFRSNGNPKAEGLGFTISYPVGWRLEEGKHPHVLASVYSEMRNPGEPQSALAITVAGAPAGVTVSDVISELQSPDSRTGALAGLTGSGEIVGYGFATIERLPFVWIRYAATHERMSERIRSESLSYFTIHSGKTIGFNYATNVRESYGDAELRKAFDSQIGLFESMMNTFVFEDAWK